MKIFKHYEKVIECMDAMSNDIYKLTNIVSKQQEQIRALTGCVEQLQDVILADLDKDLE